MQWLSRTTSAVLPAKLGPFTTFTLFCKESFHPCSNRLGPLMCCLQCLARALCMRACCAAAKDKHDQQQVCFHLSPGTASQHGAFKASLVFHQCPPPERHAGRSWRKECCTGARLLLARRASISASMFMTWHGPLCVQPHNKVVSIPGHTQNECVSWSLTTVHCSSALHATPESLHATGCGSAA